MCISVCSLTGFETGHLPPPCPHCCLIPLSCVPCRLSSHIPVLCYLVHKSAWWLSSLWAITFIIITWSSGSFIAFCLWVIYLMIILSHPCFLLFAFALEIFMFTFVFNSVLFFCLECVSYKQHRAGFRPNIGSVSPTRLFYSLFIYQKNQQDQRDKLMV